MTDSARLINFKAPAAYRCPRFAGCLGEIKINDNMEQSLVDEAVVIPR